MKYDLTRPPTRSATRALTAFSNAFFNLLTEKSFEEISVNEICDAAGYPRATFYNYFNDKYDLLNYLWYRVSSKIQIEDYKNLDRISVLPVFFSRFYDLLESLEDNLTKILTHNSGDGYFLGSLHIYFNTQIKTIVEGSGLADRLTIPRDLASAHYANTLYLIFEWRFIKHNFCSKEKAYDYLIALFKGTPPDGVDPPLNLAYSPHKTNDAPLS